MRVKYLCTKIHVVLVVVWLLYSFTFYNKSYKKFDSNFAHFATHYVEEENKKLRDELLAAKEESEKLLKRLLDPAKQKKETEDLIDFLRRHEVGPYQSK